ncbi:MAG: hypothetical protein COA75_04670 [Cellvibrionales bacterium]|nr:MAG: hypothetical protein COA75_04670 [Cellvibrionales bacterium]
MAKEGTLNLLIAHDDSDDTGRLISLLEGASYQVDAQVVTSAEELATLLKSRQWDLVIAQLQATTLPAKKLMAGIRNQRLDIPAILISNSSDIVDVVEGIRMGASYVVPVDEDQYFLLATSRTLEQLEQRRAQHDWQERYSAAEIRCEELMDSSRNAIALVQDGTYIYTNEPFNQLMGYSDPDDMLMAPVIDTIASSFQEEIKPFLKPLDPNGELDKTVLSLSFITTDEERVELQTNICQVEYQGDAALQFLIKNEIAATTDSATVIKAESNAFELDELLEIDETLEIDEILTSVEKAAQEQTALAIDPQATLNNIALAISSAQSGDGQDSLILCALAEQDAQIRKDTSESNADQILLALADFIVEQTNKQVVVSRDKQDVINFVIADFNLQEGKQFAETLCQQVAEHTFQVGAQSILMSTSLSIGLITRNTASAQVCIDECLRTLDEADPDSSATDMKVYVMDAMSQTDFSVDSEEKVTLFGQQLLEKRLIGIAFQAIVGLNDDSAEFYEVLMRPKIEEYPENIPPDFISKVFDSPIATEIDRWVILETVIKLGKKLQTAPLTCLFINLSAASIQDEKFCSWLQLALKTSKTPPANITFQLRESDAGRYIAQSETLISQLRTMGCRIAMTHFGLSSSPLLVLEKLDFDFVKLDRELIQNIKAGGERQEETQQLIVLLKEMKQHCVAPFIESPTLIPTLWQSGIEYIQGHYIQTPSPEMDYDFNEED